jgi:hypothetical protein
MGFGAPAGARGIMGISGSCGGSDGRASANVGKPLSRATDAN